MSLERGLELADADAGHGHRTDLGDGDLALAVDHQLGYQVDRAPDLQLHLVAGAEHIVGGRCDIADRGVGLRLREQFRAVDRQQLASRFLHEALELAGLGRLGWALEFWGQFGQDRLVGGLAHAEVSGGTGTGRTSSQLTRDAVASGGVAGTSSA